MKRSHRNAQRPALASLRRRSWLYAAVFLVCCGGKNTSEQTPPAGGAAGTDASGASNGAGTGGAQLTTGGAAASGSGNIILGSSGGELSGGGTLSYAGAAGADDAPCDVTQLVEFIVQGGVGVGQCQLVDPPTADEIVGVARGAVVLDSEGRVIDNTGLQPTERQAWLTRLSDERWVCLAGQTIGYQCSPAR